MLDDVMFALDFPDKLEEPGPAEKESLFSMWFSCCVGSFVEARAVCMIGAMLCLWLIEKLFFWVWLAIESALLLLFNVEGCAELVFSEDRVGFKPYPEADSAAVVAAADDDDDEVVVDIYLFIFWKRRCLFAIKISV